jgi:hypothetical protein
VLKSALLKNFAVYKSCGMAELANVSVVCPRFLGSNLYGDKIFSYIVDVGIGIQICRV